MALTLRTRKWGNSLAVVIPSETVRKLKLRSDDEVSVELERGRRNPLKELFGAGKDIRKSTRKLIDEVRGVESKWL
jgi:antitoxin component of MazEF toxin-antitoxin module